MPDWLPSTEVQRLSRPFDRHLDTLDRLERSSFQSAGAVLVELQKWEAADVEVTFRTTSAPAGRAEKECQGCLERVEAIERRQASVFRQLDVFEASLDRYRYLTFMRWLAVFFLGRRQTAVLGLLAP